jgi:hypothetical protein
MKKPNPRYEQPLATAAGGGGSLSAGAATLGALYPPLGFPPTLKDVHADPLQVRALLLAREGVIEPSDTSVYAPRVRGADDRIWALEPWVRQSLAMHDLLEPLVFSPLGGHPHGHIGLGVRGHSPFIELQRPPDSVFAAEMAQVLAYADLREDRAAEILSQIDSQWAHWASVLPLRPDRAPRTLELLTAGLQSAITVVLRAKYLMNCPRPMDCSPQVQPLITTPGHGSCPMGHAVQSFLVAGILRELLNLKETSPLNVQLQRTAFRISLNRVVAGLHFPVDLVAGMLLGQTLVRHAAQWAGDEHAAWVGSPVLFDMTRYQALGPLGGVNVGADLLREFEVVTPGSSPGTRDKDGHGKDSVWSVLWRAAQAEWAGWKHEG